MKKFFVFSNQISANEIQIFGEDVNHIKNVLRFEIGDQLEICDKDFSKNYNCEIIDISKEYVKCKILRENVKKDESNVRVTVFQGLPKADKMEFVIQKGTELGAFSFVPVEFSRCIVKLNLNDSLKKIDRWQKISEMAAKQSKRDLIPKIETLINVKTLCDKIKDFDLCLLAFENENQNSLKNELLKIKNTNDKLNIAIIIGPEGGVEEKEVELLKSAGAKVVTLGTRILRTETVALSMISIIMYELET